MESTGFSPIATPDIKVLILGSMPGVKSLDKSQYYGNQQNSFWRIMSELLAFSIDQSYDQRVKQLQKNHVGVWDVIAQCYRPGSLDSSIESSSIVANDFGSFLKTHSKVDAIFFNGAKAEQEFNKRVRSRLDQYELAYFKLLSTSPANARYRYHEKLENWRLICNYL